MLDVNLPTDDDLEVFNLNAGAGDDQVNVQAIHSGLVLNVDTGLGVGDVTSIGSVAPLTALSLLTGIQGIVNVSDSGGVGALVISDALSAQANSYVLDESLFTGTSFIGSINYLSGITALTIYGGAGGSHFLVEDTKEETDTTIHSGNGTDVVNVVATTGPLTIDGNDGFGDVVNIGDIGILGLPGTVQNIKGQVTLRKSGSGTLDAFVDDFSNPSLTNATLAFNLVTGFADLTGQAPATIRYLPDEVGTFVINAGPASNSLKVDFSQGNPIADGATNNFGGLGYFGQGDGLLILINDLPTGAFFQEDSVAGGPGSGQIFLTDSLLNNTRIFYAGLAPVDDTTSAINYTFTTPNLAAQNVSLLDTTVNGFNGTRIVEASNGFERQDIANKQNVTIDVGALINLLPFDASVTINNPNAMSGPHDTPLQNLTVNTYGGNDQIKIIATPAIPNVKVTTGSGDDAVSVFGPGILPNTVLSLDGGAGGNDKLDYDAAGTNVDLVALGANLLIFGPNGFVDAVNFEDVVIRNLEPVPPVINAPLTVNSVEGLQLVNVDVATFTSASPGARVRNFTATIDWGDGSPVTAGVIVQDSNDPTLYYVRGTHTYRDQGSFNISTSLLAGETTETTVNGGVRVTRITAAGGPVGPTVSANVSVSNAPLVLSVNPISGVAGTATPTLVLANFIDQGGVNPNHANPAGDYVVTVNWGDGSPTVTLPAGAVTQIGNTNSFQITASHLYARVGQYVVTVNVSDADLPAPLVSVTATAPVFIASATLSNGVGVPVTATEGTPLVNVPVATFVDNNPTAVVGDFTATIDWGDGTLSLGTISQPGGAGTPFQVTGNHVYKNDGSYPILVVVRGAGSQQITIGTTATVADAALTAPIGLPVSVVAGQKLSDVPLGTFLDGNKFGTAGDFTVSIDWGDGSAADTTTGVVTLVGGTANGARFRVGGSHTYNTVGSYTIKITVLDAGGQSTVITTLASVLNAALAPQGATITGTEGLATGNVLVATFTDANPSSLPSVFTATIDWGDGTPVTTGTVTAIGTPNGTTYRVTGDHTYKTVGVFSVSVAISNTGGAQTIAHATAVIADAPLNALIPQPVVNATEGTPFSGVVAAFVDANPFASANGFKAVIDWGDGTPTSFGTVTQPGGVGTAFLVSGSHTYINSGVNGGVGHFPILVQILGDSGSSLTTYNTANVADQVLLVRGVLDRASDSGQSNTDGITNVSTPVFFGDTSEAGSTIKLHARPTSGGALILIGQTSADLSGHWQITSSFLADGSYDIFVTAIDPLGKTVSAVTAVMPNSNQGPLVIDTVGPKVTNAQFARLNGQVLVTYQDDRSGMNQTTLVDAANYTFNKLKARPTGSYLVSSLVGTLQGPLSTQPQQVSVTLNNGARIRGGFYLFTAKSASSALPSGIQDVAGNALDGEFYGNFPSGNHVRGGDFVAQLDAVHNRVFPAQTVIGTAAPATPNRGLGLKASTQAVPANSQRQNLQQQQRSIAVVTPSLQAAAVDEALSLVSTGRKRKSN